MKLEYLADLVAKILKTNPKADLKILINDSKYLGEIIPIIDSYGNLILGIKNNENT